MAESWKVIPDFDQYEVSNTGHIRNRKTGHILAGSKDTHGYPCFWPKKKGRRYCLRIHRCVAEAFIPNPDALPEVNHINGNKADDRVENLEWVTRSENRAHAYRTGLRTKSSNRPVLQVEDGLPLWQYASLTEASRETGIGLSNISMAVGGHSKSAGGYTWEYVKED